MIRRLYLWPGHFWQPCTTRAKWFGGVIMSFWPPACYDFPTMQLDLYYYACASRRLTWFDRMSGTFHGDQLILSSYLEIPSFCLFYAQIVMEQLKNIRVAIIFGWKKYKYLGKNIKISGNYCLSLTLSKKTHCGSKNDNCHRNINFVLFIIFAKWQLQVACCSSSIKRLIKTVSARLK